MLKEGKVILLGRETVGKTCIITRETEGVFNEETKHTYGCCFSEKKYVVNDESFKLLIWDTAGQERYKSITPYYYRDAQVVILVFSLCNQLSFNALENWINEVKENTVVDPTFICVGNKCDLRPIVDKSEIKGFVERNNIRYFETSAKTGTNIFELFQYAAEEAFKKAVVKEEPVIPARKSCCE